MPKSIFSFFIVLFIVSSSTVFCDNKAQIKMKVYHDISKPLKIKAFRNVKNKIYVEENLLRKELEQKKNDREEQQAVSKWKTIKINVEIFDVSDIDSFESFFEDNEDIVEIDFVKFQNKDINNYSKMFKGCYRLERVNISCLSCGTVKQCSEMFYGCSNLKEIVGLEQLDMSKVRDISGMFQKCYHLIVIDGSQDWALKNVKTCENLFCDCGSLTIIKNIDNFIQNKVENISGMFKNCSSLTTLTVNGWDTSNVKDMSSCFEGCTVLKHIIGLEKLNLSNLENLYRTFSNCKELVSVEQTENWELKKITNISYIFNNCLKLKSFYWNHWNSKGLKKIEGLFSGCTNLEHISGLEQMDVKNITSLERLFYGCESLEEITCINEWNVERIENIDYLFYDCKKICSLDLTKWTITHLKSAQEVFGGCDNLESLKLGCLDFSGVQIKKYKLKFFYSILIKIIIMAVVVGVSELLFRKVFSCVSNRSKLIRCIIYNILLALILASNIFFYPQKSVKQNKLKYLSLLKTVFPTIDYKFFSNVFCLSLKKTKLVAINAPVDNIQQLMSLSRDDVYFCCQHGTKEEIIKNVKDITYRRRVIECDQEKVDVFFDENINLPYNELKEKFEKVFIKNDVCKTAKITQ